MITGDKRLLFLFYMTLTGLAEEQFLQKTLLDLLTTAFFISLWKMWPHIRLGAADLGCAA